MAYKKLNEKVEIRILKPKDAINVHRLNRRVWKGDKNIHSLKEIRGRIKSSGYACFGAFIRGRLVGFTFIDFDFKSRKIRLLHTTVDKNLQNRGVASMMLEEIERYCKKKGKNGIFVFLSNDYKDAIKWAKWAGFVKAGQSKWLYRGDRTAYIYYKKIA